MIRSQSGYTFVELMAVMVMIGVLMAASIMSLGNGRTRSLAQTARTAMMALKPESPSWKYPASVTISNLVSHGAAVSDWSIDSYERTGTPTGVNFQLQIKSPDDVVFCITETTFEQSACPS